MTLSVADRLAISELMARYNHAIDITRDTEAWLTTFTDDALWVTGRGVTCHGIDELRASFERGTEWLRRTSEPPLRHWISNVVFDPLSTDRRAHSTCSLLLIALTAAGPQIDRTGVYKDTLRKVDGDWRFSERMISIDQYPRNI